MTNSFHLKLRILLYSSVADLQCRLLHYCQYVGFTLGGPYTYRYSTSCHCGYATPAIMSSCLHRRCVVHNDCNILMRHRSAKMSALRICHLPITNTYIHIDIHIYIYIYINKYTHPLNGHIGPANTYPLLCP